MSNPFNPGDRVRVVGLENETPSTEIAAAVLRGEVDGEVTNFNEKWTVANFGGQNFHVPTKNLQRVSPRRTFEEIINELRKKLDALGASFLVTVGEFFDEEDGESETYEFHFHHGCGEITITLNYDGSVSIEPRNHDGEAYAFLGHDQLAAISAACTEIAANYQAEHGKEDTRHA